MEFIFFCNLYLGLPLSAHNNNGHCKKDELQSTEHINRAAAANTERATRRWKLTCHFQWSNLSDRSTWFLFSRSMDKVVHTSNLAPRESIWDKHRIIQSWENVPNSFAVHDVFHFLSLPDILKGGAFLAG